jgi:hypothetical protein
LHSSASRFEKGGSTLRRAKQLPNYSRKITPNDKRPTMNPTAIIADDM